MNTLSTDLHWEHPSFGQIKGVISLTNLQEDPQRWLPSADFWSMGEVDAWNRLKFAKRQRQYMAGRYAAKAAVSKWLGGLPYQRFSIESGVFQQPLVKSEQWDVPTVSIAHTDDCGIALAVPAGFPVGIDIEDFTEERLRSVQSIFEEHFGRPPEKSLPKESAEILEWTAHESLSKALLIGLTFPFDKIVADRIVTLEDGFWRWTWRDFTQYQTLVFVLGRHVVAMTYFIQAELMGDGGDKSFMNHIKGLLIR